MRMRVHEPDLATEERRGFRSPEEDLRATMIGERPVHEAHAVEKAQACADQAEVVLELLRGEKRTEYALYHRQQRVADSRAAVRGMEQQLRHSARRIEHRIARHRAIAHEEPVEILAHRRSEALLGR